MSDAWYYARGNQQQGPVTGAALRQMLATGQLHPSSLVWTHEMPQWAPASSVPQLAAAGHPIVPPPAYGAAYPMGAAQPYPAAAPGLHPLGYAAGGPYAGYGEVRYAGFWLRAVAWLIDVLVMIAFGALVGGCIGGVIGGSMGARHATPQQIRQTVVETVAPIVRLLQIIGGWLYFALMESSARQATLGKMALGLRVTDEQGRRIGFGRATGRYFAKIISALILFIGFIMAGFTTRKQALHDMIAGTLVVKK
jgi:uncharacterized RDD family membrane protein YckC